MARKIAVFILIIGLLLATLPGCTRGISQTTKDSTSESAAVTDTSTPTSASTSQTEATAPVVTPTTAPVPPGTDVVYGNGGPVLEQGDWLYFCIWRQFAGIYKIREDGTDRTKLYDFGYVPNSYSREEPFYIAGEWIYFLDNGQSGAPTSVDLYKMKTDGTDLTKLLTMPEIKIIFMQVEGEWIYFSTRQDKNLQSGQYPFNLYRLKTDGTGLELILEDMQIFALQDGWAYGLENSQARRMYRVYIDGTQMQILSDEFVWDLIVKDNWIYYVSCDSYGYPSRLCKMQTDGSEKMKLSDDPERSCFLLDNEIYYRSAENFRPICKIQTDGTGKTEIHSAIDDSELIAVVNGWLYLLQISTPNCVWQEKNPALRKIRNPAPQRRPFVLSRF